MNRTSFYGDWRKYKNKRTTIKGIHYDSKFESKVGKDLEYRMMAKDIACFSRQVNFPLVVNGIKITTYRADFVVEHNDKSLEVVEAKGFLTDLGRIKLLLFEALFPQYKLTIVRQ